MPVVFKKVIGKVSKLSKNTQFSDFKLNFSGGKNQNIKIGDSAFGLEIDHAEPCVSLTSFLENKKKQNFLFNYLPCVGNKVYKERFESDFGIITGKHGGRQGHVIADFPDTALEKTSSKEKFIIECNGQNCRTGVKNVKMLNCDSSLFTKFTKRREDNIIIAMKNIVPDYLIGSGIGSKFGVFDIDIISDDNAELKNKKLSKIKLGDIIGLDNICVLKYPTRIKGFITIGVISHGDSKIPGHGPGVTPLITGKKENITIKTDSESNIGKLLKIGRYR